MRGFSDIIALCAAWVGVAGRPIADVEVHLELLPVVGTRHWLLTEDPHRHLLHAIVTPALAVDLVQHDDWLLDVLKSIG